MSVFIIHRRTDTQQAAGRLADRLKERFGPEAVVIGFDADQVGRDHGEMVTEHLETADVVLTLIGLRFLEEGSDGERRLDRPDDPLRVELTSALERDVPVVPVLVDGAELPGPDDLPDELQELVFRGSLELAHQRFEDDYARLEGAVERFFEEAERKAAAVAGRLSLTVIDVTGRRAYPATLPADVACLHIIEQLVLKMGLPAVWPDGEPKHYHLHHKRSGRQLSDMDSLGDVGVVSGDTLRLVPTLPSAEPTFVAARQLAVDEDEGAAVAGRLSLTVIDVTGRRAYPATLPADVACLWIIAQLVPQMGLPRVGPGGAPQAYNFSHKESGRQLSDMDTLGDVGVVSGDTLRLVPTISAGDSAPRTHLRQLAVDDDVQFTVYKPAVISSAAWAPLLAFAHVTSRSEVQALAEELLGKSAATYTQLLSDASGPVPRGDHIRFVPEVPGVAFSPRSATIRWEEQLHVCEFQVRAERDAKDVHRRGLMYVYLGPLILSTITLAFEVRTQTSASIHESAHERRYRNIFPSYSHRDQAVVRDIRRAVETLGDRYIQDVVALRSGEEWQPRLETLINEADVFQLFWSSNSMRSEFVRREWTYALSLNRPGFVRPMFWEMPRPESREEGLPPPELDQLHFARLGGAIDGPLRVECRSCDFANPAHSNFCSYCGESLQIVRLVEGAGDLATAEEYGAARPEGHALPGTVQPHTRNGRQVSVPWVAIGVGAMVLTLVVVFVLALVW